MECTVLLLFLAGLIEGGRSMNSILSNTNNNFFLSKTVGYGTSISILML